MFFQYQPYALAWGLETDDDDSTAAGSGSLLPPLPFVTSLPDLSVRVCS